MTRWFLVFVVGCVLPLSAQDQPQLKKREEGPPKQTAIPPEEDKSLATHEYGFNPVQAKKEIGVGNQYFKKGSYRAAAGRFEEATKWNSGDGEAWLRLAEAQEKLRDKQVAKAAYTKYL